MNTKHKCNEDAKHRWYDVIVAWASGKKIQYNFENTGWCDFVFSQEVPGFSNVDTLWRVKPKTITKKYRMALVNRYGGKSIFALDLSLFSLDFPAEREVQGFIRWVGDAVEVEIEV